MSNFNLRQLVRDVMESSTIADPGQLAEEVLSRIQKRDEHEALMQYTLSNVFDVGRREIRQQLGLP